MKLFYQYMAIFFNFSPKSNHLHPLQVENCDSNSQLVVDEDDNGKFRLERAKTPVDSGRESAGHRASFRCQSNRGRSSIFLCQENGADKVSYNLYELKNLKRWASFVSLIQTTISLLSQGSQENKQVPATCGVSWRPGISAKKIPLNTAVSA